MGWLASEKPPDKYSSAYFKMLVERLRTALNFLSEENFSSGLSGSIINDRSLAMSKLTGYGGLPLYEDFFTLMQSETITATTLSAFGSSVLFDPLMSTLANVYLEVTCSAADATHACTVEVHSPNGALLSQSITDATFSRREFQIPTNSLPTAPCTLVFKASVSNATYPLTILSARLILKLSEIMS
jgi:hypothetical protein